MSQRAHLLCEPRQQHDDVASLGREHYYERRHIISLLERDAAVTARPEPSCGARPFNREGQMTGEAWILGNLVRDRWRMAQVSR
jgi:hypothetical protein